jgi:FkbM family methyltransferase
MAFRNTGVPFNPDVNLKNFSTIIFYFLMYQRSSYNKVLQNMIIIKTILKKPWINQPIHKILRKILKVSSQLSIKLGISGTVELSLAGQKIKWYTEGDDGLATRMFYNTFHETKDLELFCLLAKNATTILDIGAFAGIYSVLASVTNPRAKVIAFEPSESNFKRLEKNVAINKINIEIENVAVGNSNKPIDFYIPTENILSESNSVNGAFVKEILNKHTKEGVETKIKKTTVSQVYLDEFIPKNNITSLDLIKIDVETHEMAVFDGASETFKHFSPVIIIEIFLDEERKNYFNAFCKESRYYAYIILNSGLLRLDEGMISNHDSANYLFSKKKTHNPYLSFSNTSTDWVKELM